MASKKIVLAGGTGFVGRYLSSKYEALGYEVINISRQKNCINWQDEAAIISAINDSVMLINLAGKSVDCRYSEANKKEILESRTGTTTILGKAILQCSQPPALWVNSSTATIYRHAEDRPMTELNGEIGTGFSVNVATAWEKSFFDFQLPSTRQVALRMAIVLGKDGGVMKPFKNLVRFGFGGQQGNGKQMFSWIHIEDVFRMIEFVSANKNLKGAYNCCAPKPVMNRELMRLLRAEMKVPIGLPSPKMLLEIGARFINTETELILKSRWVLPERIQQAGFVFAYDSLDEALHHIIAK
jgi:uncharacterized protein